MSFTNLIFTDMEKSLSGVKDEHMTPAKAQNVEDLRRLMTEQSLQTYRSSRNADTNKYTQDGSVTRLVSAYSGATNHTNIEFNPSDAFSTRMEAHVLTMHNLSSCLGRRNATINTEMLPNELENYDISLKTFKTLHAMTINSWVMMENHLIPIPPRKLSVACVSNVSTNLKLPPPVRSTQMSSSLKQTEKVVSALHELYFTPLSPFRYFDATPSGSKKAPVVKHEAFNMGLMACVMTPYLVPDITLAVSEAIHPFVNDLCICGRLALEIAQSNNFYPSQIRKGVLSVDWIWSKVFGLSEKTLVERVKEEDDAVNQDFLHYYASRSKKGVPSTSKSSSASRTVKGKYVFPHIVEKQLGISDQSVSIALLKIKDAISRIISEVNFVNKSFNAVKNGISVSFSKDKDKDKDRESRQMAGTDDEFMAGTDNDDKDEIKMRRAELMNDLATSFNQLQVDSLFLFKRDG